MRRRSSVGPQARARALLIVLNLFALITINARPPRASAADIDIWLDAGHGGGDAGALGFDQASPYPEKTATLEVATKVFNLLGTAGFVTFMTRYGDSYPTLSQRVGMANGVVANEAAEIGTCQAFVSVHMNSNKSSNALGTEVYYSRHRAGPQVANAYRADSGLATSVYNRLIQNTPGAFMGCNSNRGVKAANYFVIKWPFTSAILAEVCFISNQCQQQKVRQAGNQALVASGIVSGITDAITPGGTPASPAASALPLVASLPEPWVLHGSEPSPAGGTAVLSLGETFDGATFPPAGWTVMSAGQPAPHFWARQTDGAYVHAGTGAAVVGGRSAGTVDEWLISPLTFLSPSDRGLQFYWLGNRTWAPQANATCLVRPQGSGTWTTIWSLLDEGPGQEFQYSQRIIDVSPWLGSSVEFAFRVAGANGADFAVDDVLTGNLNPFPVAPANDVCATAQTLPSGSFEFAGSTCAANNSLDPYHANSFSCASDNLSGGDVFYHFTAASGDTIDANLAGDWQGALYVMTACDTAVTSCVAASQVLELSDTSSVATLHHVFSAGGTYYLGVDGVGGECGVFHLTGNLRGPTTDVRDGPGIAPDFRLHVAPNPATGSVFFSGTVSGGGSSTGTLRVFDAAGRQIWRSTIRATSGRFVAAWDGRGGDGVRAASGTYLVRVDFHGRTVSTARMVLLD
jgi:N-acetylmuramoyl-L-alanine amidase